MTEDEMVGRHHRLDRQEFEQALRDAEGQGSLACCSPCGCKDSDMTQQLNNTSGLKGGPKEVVHVLIPRICEKGVCNVIKLRVQR